MTNMIEPSQLLLANDSSTCTQAANQHQTLTNQQQVLTNQQQAMVDLNDSLTGLHWLKAIHESNAFAPPAGNVGKDGKDETMSQGVSPMSHVMSQPVSSSVTTGVTEAANLITKISGASINIESIDDDNNDEAQFGELEDADVKQDKDGYFLFTLPITAGVINIGLGSRRQAARILNNKI